MATATTEHAIDFAARYREAQGVLAYFSRFDDRGLDARAEQAALLFDALDRYEQAWEWTLRNAVKALVGLADTALFLDAAAGESTRYQISKLEDKYI